jgi:hypothetical protein
VGHEAFREAWPGSADESRRHRKPGPEYNSINCR